MSNSSNRSEILLDVGTNEVEIFEFIVNGQSFGVNVAKIQQILRRDGATITRLDMAPEGVLGTTHFRKKPVLVVDSHKILGMPPASENSDRQLLMVTEFNQITTAFLIDGAVRIHRVSWSQLSPMESGLSSAPPYVTSVVNLEGRLILVLDLEYILAKISPSSAVKTEEEVTVDAVSDAKLKDISILFSEDSAMIRTATISSLKKAGLENIIVAHDGGEAYSKLLEIKERAKAENKTIEDYVQLVLTDIEMPQMDGLTLCKKIREELGLKKIPVLVYSSLINEQMMAKCKLVGATESMSKPAIDKVISTINEYRKA